MHRMEKTCDIDVPVRVAYDQWTQFEQFPQFMDGVKEVKQLDDTHLHWRASVGGKDKEWDAEIVEQVPDQVIKWRSTSGPRNEGEVRFDKIPGDHTRVRLAMVYEPEGAVEKAGDAMGFLSRQVDKTLDDFKDYIEKRGHESGAWRGEVHGGREESDDTPGMRGRTGAMPGGDGLRGRSAAGNPGALGAAPGAAGGTYPGGTGGTPAPGGGVPGSTSGPGMTPGGRR